jgi:RHS repeat-associated protein
LTNGTALVSNYFNPRLQPCRFAVNTSGTAPGSCADATNKGNVLDLTYNFGLGADNGNVLGITNNITAGRSLTAAYDMLNRIASAYTSTWSEQYGIDVWGNLTSITNMPNKPAGENLSLSATTQNQFVGMSYDAAGNLTNDGAGLTPGYNAEGQLVYAGGWTSRYDGDGKRLSKRGYSSFSVEGYGYGIGTDPLYETNYNNAILNEYVFFNGRRIARRDGSGNVFYYFTDHLGTSREIVQAGQTLPCYDADFYPFGREQMVYTNTCPQNYKFTGKERDGNGLDNFGARYNSSQYGRFMTPDPFIPFNLKRDKFQAWISNPQHWNKYAYALNNPLLYVDPSGMTETIYYWLDSGLTEKQKKFFEQHKTEILNGVADKLKQAGIKDVVFKEGSSLTNAQVQTILQEQPKGVAFLNFADKSIGGVNASPGQFGGTAADRMRSAVFVGNLQEGNPSADQLMFRIGEVASHELGHGMGFYSRGETMSFIMFWNKDLMNEGQGMPTSPRQFDMSILQNRQAVDQINELPEYNAPQ